MKLLKAFLKDHIPYFIGYIGITALIILYYYLSAGSRIGILYPVILALFVTAVISIIRGIRYFRFHRALKTAEYNDYLLSSASCQERHIITMLRELHKDYQNRLNRLRKQKLDADTFIAQMAHDIKMPVSVIRLILENTEEQPLSVESREKIITENDKISDKLSQLLCYLRLEQFEKDYLIEPLNLVEEVRNAINRKKDYFILNQVFPQFASQQEPVQILSDRKWHGVLLDQIISNAIKYTAAGNKEGHVRFEIHKTDSSTELVIADDGIGIPTYDLERIFEPFFTGENGRKIGSSSGIGLYLCRSIADRLGHGLLITSVQDEGTVVSLRYLSKM